MKWGSNTAFPEQLKSQNKTNKLGKEVMFIEVRKAGNLVVVTHNEQRKSRGPEGTKSGHSITVV
jgi:hypothetical protein